MKERDSMDITLFKDVNDYLLQAEDYLRKEEAANNLILGVALQVRQNPKAYGQEQPFMAVVHAGGEIQAVALMTPPYNLLVYSENINNRQAYETIIDTLQRENIYVPGVVGEKERMDLFCKLWKERTGKDYQLYMAQRVYALHSVTFPDGVPGSMRAAEESDLKLLEAWTAAFYEESLPGQEPPDLKQYTLDYFRKGAFYLWIDGEQPVSTASGIRPQGKNISVSLVYTPPEFRRRGYASAVVAALSQKKLDEGYSYCTLFTDLSNPTSNDIYQKIGYRPVCDYMMYHFS